MLQALYSGLKDAKAEALLITHTVHPSFGDACDMVRLNDLSEIAPRSLTAICRTGERHRS